VVETPEATDDHADETPQPSATDGGEDDHSGPGGGDD
jgi:hypothetical protein